MTNHNLGCDCQQCLLAQVEPANHEQCRLVRVTEEVSEQQDRFPVDAHGCSG